MQTIHTNYPTLDLIIGSMYANKTSELLRRLDIFTAVNFKVCYINSSLDNRSNTYFSTHNPLINNMGKIVGIKCHNLKDADISNFDIIGIDEAQLFDDLLIVIDYVEKYNKKVIVAGLNSDYKRNPFGHINELIPYSDNITKLFPCCKSCIDTNNELRPAIFTKRTTEDTDVIVIGDTSKYIPVCRKCYLLK